MDFSIVVPVYNTGEYLERCLSSILHQDFLGKFEVIVVNDGSTDDSAEILNKLSLFHTNISIITLTKNESLAVARRKGIEASTGNYIMHVDSDDWIESKSLNTLYEEIKSNNFPDVIVYGYQRVNEHKTLSVFQPTKSKKIFNASNKYELEHLFLGCSVVKLVKRRLLQDLIFGTQYMNSTEDLIYCVEIFERASKISLIPDILYNYYINPKSITSSIVPVKYIKAQSVVYELLQKCNLKYNFSDKRIGFISKYLDNYIITAIYVDKFRNTISEEIFNTFINKYKLFKPGREQFFIKIYRSRIYNFIAITQMIGFLRSVKMTCREYYLSQAS